MEKRSSEEDNYQESYLDKIWLQQIQAQLQQMQQQYHNQQIWKVSECARKLDEFLKSAEELDPQYQQLAFAECCAMLGKHMSGTM